MGIVLARWIFEYNNLANQELYSINTWMIERRIKSELAKRLDEVPAVVLLGPRQVGKTTLAQEIGEGRPSLYLDLGHKLINGIPKRAMI